MRRMTRAPAPPSPARGQAMVEFSMAVIFFVGLLLGFFDLARGYAAQAAVTEMAWAGARYAASGACLAIRYAAAGPTEGGQDEAAGGCPDGDRTTVERGNRAMISPAQREAIVARARGAAFGIDADSAAIGVTLPDGSPRAGQRVRVEVSYAYVPVASYFVGGRPVELRGSSTLLIMR